MSSAMHQKKTNGGVVTTMGRRVEGSMPSFQK